MLTLYEKKRQKTQKKHKILEVKFKKGAISSCHKLKFADPYILAT